MEIPTTYTIRFTTFPTRPRFARRASYALENTRRGRRYLDGVYAGLMRGLTGFTWMSMNRMGRNEGVTPRTRGLCGLLGKGTGERLNEVSVTHSQVTLSRV